MEHFDNFINQISLIDTEIEKSNSVREETLPLLDGVINPEQYYKSTPRILWILKEPYDEFDETGQPIGGGWNYRSALNNKLNEFKNIATWRRIAYTSFGIINNCFYDDMDDLQKDKTTIDRVFESIRNIAFINIKKTPGKTSSKYSEINEAYEKNREILIKQIECFKPNIIIGGGTLTYLYNDFLLNAIKKEDHGLKYYIENNILFIDAYHPSYPKGDDNEKEYIDGIISVYKDFCKQLITS